MKIQPGVRIEGPDGTVGTVLSWPHGEHKCRIDWGTKVTRPMKRSIQGGGYTILRTENDVVDVSRWVGLSDGNLFANAGGFIAVLNSPGQPNYLMKREEWDLLTAAASKSRVRTDSGTLVPFQEFVAKLERVLPTGARLVPKNMLP